MEFANFVLLNFKRFCYKNGPVLGNISNDLIGKNRIVKILIIKNY